MSLEGSNIVVGAICSYIPLLDKLSFEMVRDENRTDFQYLFFGSVVVNVVPLFASFSLTSTHFHSSQ